MKEKHSQRSGAPLVEIIIALGVFALCSVVIVRLFLGAHFAALCSADQNQAVFHTQSAVEQLKGANGETGPLEAAGFALGEKADGTQLTAYYDEDWQPSGQKDALFEVTISFNYSSNTPPRLLDGQATCRRMDNYPFLEKDKANLCTLEFAHYAGVEVAE